MPLPALLCFLSLSFAEVPFQLPANEDVGVWSRPLDLSGFSPGYAGGAGVWARVVPLADGTWVIEVRDANGELRRSTPQPPPANSAEREKLAALAHSLTRPDAALPPLRVAPARPRPTPTPSAPPPTPPDPPQGPGSVPLFTDSTRDRMESLSERPEPRIDGLLPRDLQEMCICSFYLAGEGGESLARTYLFNTGCSCDSPTAPQDDEPLHLPRTEWR